MAASEGQCSVIRGCAKTTSHSAAGSRACRLRGIIHSILQAREPATLRRASAGRASAALPPLDDDAHQIRPIACVAAPCICPSGARTRMRTYFAPPLIEAAAVGIAYTIVSSYERRLKETKPLEAMQPKGATGNRAKQHWKATYCPAVSTNLLIGTYYLSGIDIAIPKGHPQFQ
jgi:hypothetical protein